MQVYFIQDEGGDIKIGFGEDNPHRRLRTFRTGNPRELALLVSIPGGAAEEKALHERFKDLRGRGEWFKPDARLLGFIEGLQYTYRAQQPTDDAGADPSEAGVTTYQLDIYAGYAFANIICESMFDCVENVSVDNLDKYGPTPSFVESKLIDSLGTIQQILSKHDRLYEADPPPTRPFRFGFSLFVKRHDWEYMDTLAAMRLALDRGRSILDQSIDAIVSNNDVVR